MGSRLGWWPVAVERRVSIGRRRCAHVAAVERSVGTVQLGERKSQHLRKMDGLRGQISLPGASPWIILASKRRAEIAAIEEHALADTSDGVRDTEGSEARA